MLMYQTLGITLIDPLWIYLNPNGSWRTDSLITLEFNAALWIQTDILSEGISEDSNRNEPVMPDGSHRVNSLPKWWMPQAGCTSSLRFPNPDRHKNYAPLLSCVERENLSDADLIIIMTSSPETLICRVNITEKFIYLKICFYLFVLGRGRGREEWKPICCSTYLCINWLSIADSQKKL